MGAVQGVTQCFVTNISLKHTFLICFEQKQTKVHKVQKCCIQKKLMVCEKNWHHALQYTYSLGMLSSE